MKRCHLLLLRVIPLYEFWGWFRVEYSGKSARTGERWGLRVPGWGRGGSAPTLWAPRRGWVPPTMLGMTGGDQGTGVPQKLSSGGCCGVQGPCTPHSPGSLWVFSFFVGVQVSRVGKFPGAAIPAGSALPGLAVTDVTLGMESEKNCPWFLSAAPGKRRLGSSGARR